MSRWFIDATPLSAGPDALESGWVWAGNQGIEEPAVAPDRDAVTGPASARLLGTATFAPSSRFLAPDPPPAIRGQQARCQSTRHAGLRRNLPVVNVKPDPQASVLGAVSRVAGGYSRKSQYRQHVPAKAVRV